MNQFTDLNEDEENPWYPPHSSSPPSSLSVNNSFTHQSSSATMNSWGFDINRSTNGQIPSNNNNSNNDQQTMIRTTKDYNEPFVDISSSPQNLKLRTPMLTRQRHGNEFSAVDRLLLGPNRMESFPQQQQLISTNQYKTQTEQELLAWQNRMLERDQRFTNPSPKLPYKQNETNSSRSSTRQIPTSIRPISAMSNISENQHDHHESTIKSARVIKRYIELLYHLQSFYERIMEQLFNGNSVFKTNQSIFTNHCRKIAEQLQNCKPVWEEKLSDLQNLLKDISSSQLLTIETETTFLQRRSTLINLLQTLSTQKDLDLSIRTDIDRVLHEDKLAIQLQDELSTLLQHQSLLNDFTSLLQWNRQIYSSHEQNRVENVLPFLREQSTTTDSYISHVSQQLTELVKEVRLLEKYILSYTNSIPLIDDAIVPSQRISVNRSRWRSYDETDVDSMRIKESRKTNDNPSKIRSISMPRSEEFDHNFDRDDFRQSSKKNHPHLNTNNSNNNRTSTRIATIKSAKRDYKPLLNSILKPSSHRRRKDLEIDSEVNVLSNEGDLPHRSIDFDNDDRIRTTNTRLSKMKKKEEVRRTISKQNIQEMNDQDLSDGDFRSSFKNKRFGLQSILTGEAREKSRQVTGKHYSNKSHQQRSIYPNA